MEISIYVNNKWIVFYCYQESRIILHVTWNIYSSTSSIWNITWCNSRFICEIIPKYVHKNKHVCMYVCIHELAYIDTYIHTRNDTYIRMPTYIHARKHTHTQHTGFRWHPNSYTHIHTHTHKHTHTYTQTHTHTYTHIHTHTHIYIYTNLYANIYIYIHIYTHIHIYIHKDFDICQQMMPLWKLHLMTLTYFFNLNKFEILISQKQWELAQHVEWL